MTVNEVEGAKVDSESRIRFAGKAFFQTRCRNVFRALCLRDTTQLRLCVPCRDRGCGGGGGRTADSSVVFLSSVENEPVLSVPRICCAFQSAHLRNLCACFFVWHRNSWRAREAASRPSRDPSPDLANLLSQWAWFGAVLDLEIFHCVLDVVEPKSFEQLAQIIFVAPNKLHVAMTSTRIPVIADPISQTTTQHPPKQLRNMHLWDHVDVHCTHHAEHTLRMIPNRVACAVAGLRDKLAKVAIAYNALPAIPWRPNTHTVARLRFSFERILMANLPERRGGKRGQSYGSIDGLAYPPRRPRLEQIMGLCGASETTPSMLPKHRAADLLTTSSAISSTKSAHAPSMRYCRKGWRVRVCFSCVVSCPLLSAFPEVLQHARSVHAQYTRQCTCVAAGSF